MPMVGQYYVDVKSFENTALPTLAVKVGFVTYQFLYRDIQCVKTFAKMKFESRLHRMPYRFTARTFCLCLFETCRASC